MLLLLPLLMPVQAIAAEKAARSGERPGLVPLDSALTSLAVQSGADISSTEPGLTQIRVRPAAAGRSVAATLDMLLSGTGLHAVRVDRNSFRIVRAAIAPVRAEFPDQPRPDSEIIVTASKQRVMLLRFPGSITIVGDIDQVAPGNHGHDLDDVVHATPVLQNTEFGAGRNKLFIRGIADSSFNGATQATASVYFGDVQMGYSGPQPGIKLYDMERLEVLEGPQGTLYGAGAIGGIVRLTPRPANLAKPEASINGGLSVLSSGGSGFDLAGMVNLPLLTDRLAVRIIGYRSRDAGYIADATRRLSDVNRTDTLGGRIVLSIDAGDDWRIELGGLAQQINADDAQYAETASGPLTRRSRLAQPYTNDVKLGRIVIGKRWDSGIEISLATGLVDRGATDIFDGSRLNGTGVATAYENITQNRLLTHETRLSRSNSDGLSWVIGAALLYDRDRQSRTLGPVVKPIELIGVTNVTKSASVFGEATLPVTSRLSLTLGGRLTTARTDGEPSATPRGAPVVRGRSSRRLDPTLALSWLIAPHLAVFARAQSGYRTGGIAVAPGVGRVSDFRSDSIITGEIGVRKERRGTTGVSFSTSMSYANWRDIQADLFSARGQPFTANIGSADIYALEFNGDWVPLVGLRARVAFLYTENRVDGALAASSTRNNRRLPETPPLAATLDLSYTWADRGGSRYDLYANGRYTGRSVLGTGDYLDISQGRYALFGIGGGWHWRQFSASLAIDNVTNRHDNMFALGNPLTFTLRDQTTPLRPRTFRMGAGLNW